MKPRLTWRKRELISINGNRFAFGLYRAGVRLGVVRESRVGWCWATEGLAYRYSRGAYATPEDAKAALIEHVKACLARGEAK